MTVSLVNGKMKGLKIDPEVDKTRHERNKLGSEGPIWKTEKREDSENFSSREQIYI